VVLLQGGQVGKSLLKW